ncbi:DUF3035 domain-containing protein [Gemmobacter aquarius]|uniref:DUF3035 domain-containing protein n=1 Tax=Paragemmobacter aquarius TaxID=2169400 RepID=A0A2S0UQ36_9RHOB|nr:DUF3035 domain-containing protein [Gemmobacter aquarius]AWB49911.1 DUF3035 domain-containing protein [Gemmobacter aquarius]
MQAARGVLMVAMAAVLTLAACGRGDKAPSLMNVRSTSQGPDEFAILPPKPLTLPTDLAALPEPTPGGPNLTDPTPEADAIAALGGTLRPAGGVPASDGGLTSYAARFGIASDIRQTLAGEDLEWRRDNNGRILERLLNVNVYYKAYADMSLDQQAELWRWRQAGVRTPSAPPPKPDEK